MEMFALVAVAVSVVAQAFCCVMLWRNNIVLGCRLQRLNEISAACKHRNYSISFGDVLKQSSFGSYHDMLWDFNKWSYRAFYPRSVEECLTVQP